MRVRRALSDKGVLPALGVVRRGGGRRAHRRAGPDLLTKRYGNQEKTQQDHVTPMTDLIKTSVRDLVGFALRRGDLGAGGFASTSRLVAGTRGHQQVQRARPPGYQMEVPISHTVEAEGLALEISGRIDGLLVDEHRVLVEEIKTTHRDLDPATPDNPAHWG